MDISWDDFKNEASTRLERQQAYIFRGQANSEWLLSTSIHRTGQVRTQKDFSFYFDKIIQAALEPVEAWDGSRRDLKNEFQMAEFLALLQHNGFPTPLLDWTFSPYIAAYFAFENINHFFPQHEKVAIYAFHQEEWLKTYKQTYDWREEEAHVTLLNPTYRGNHKQMLQQGTYLFTNQPNVEDHILHNEKQKGQFLHKYEISVKERVNVFKDLKAMNISALQLAPSIESVCKKAFEDICVNLPVGLTPREHEKMIEEAIADNKEFQIPEEIEIVD